MRSHPQVHTLPDGRRLHLNHGPIDLIVEAFGSRNEVRLAYAQAVARFDTVLTELVAELPALRQPANGVEQRPFAGAIARQMEQAVMPFAGKRFVTPMAAVAGSVADEVLAAMTAGRSLDRATINNGGDIALYLASGERLTIAMAVTGCGFGDRLTIRADDVVRGVATSGWRGRSHSLGIADSVTVLASTGAAADAAATMIANAVDLPGHPSISRQPARTLAPDSDLGDRLVTTAVGALSRDEIREALARGHAAAEDFVARGLIVAAALYLGGRRVVSGLPLGLATDHDANCGFVMRPPLACRPSPPQVRRSGTSVVRSISTLVGETAGRPEGGVKELSPAKARLDARVREENHHA